MNPPLNVIPDEAKLAHRLAERTRVLFQTVPEMLADADLDYSVVGAGDIVLAQGFRYEVKAKTEDAHHLVSSAGLKLRVLPDTSERMSLSAFGADSTGTDDCLPLLQIAASAVNEAQATLVARGRFKLSGGGNVELTTDCDFSGAIFDCSTWSGRFILGRNKNVVIYGPTTEVVQQLKRSEDFEVGSSRFSGWDGCTEVSDSFVIITTEQNFYSYRSEVQKRIELNRVYRDGVISSPLRYSMAGVGVSSVKVFPMEDRRRTVKGLTLDIRGNEISSEFVRVNTSLLDLDVRFIQDENVYTPRNPTYVYFLECCQVNARVEMQWANRNHDHSYTYNFQLRLCYDIEITPQADGDGWGATGSNLSQRVTFRDGTLSRIDFHQPFMEWLRLRNMVVSHWAIVVVALGDLDLDTVTFHARALRDRTAALIAARHDAGGFCDGDLLMRNITIITDKAVGDLHLLQHSQNNTGTAKPAGTPIEYRFWRRIIVDGLQYRTQLSGDTQRLWINPGAIGYGEASVAVCEEFTLHNAHGPGLYVEVNLKDRTPSRKGLFPLKLDLENVVGEAIATQGTSANFKVNASIRNCRGYGPKDGIDIKAQAPGEYTITGGCVSRLICSGTQSPVVLRAYGVTVVYANDGKLVEADEKCDIRLVDCTFYMPTTGWLAELLKALLVRPQFIIEGRRQNWVIDLHGNPGAFELPYPPHSEQKVRLVTGYDANLTVTEVELRIPPVGRRTIVTGIHVGDKQVWGMLNRTTATRIVASGDVWFRYMLLG